MSAQEFPLYINKVILESKNSYSAEIETIVYNDCLYKIMKPTILTAISYLKTVADTRKNAIIIGTVGNLVRLLHKKMRGFPYEKEVKNL